MNVRTHNLLLACKSLEATACKDLKWRPTFHLSPVTGWMNDPNGLCQFHGQYHIFFQYSPFDVKPGLNYWGHYTTRDFIHYVYHKPALCCDEQFDCHGVYSGSAIVSDDTMYLFYTGNVKQNGNYDYINSGREHNTIRAVSRDGVHFDDKTVLKRNADYPDSVTCHVRDPKVLPYRDGYLMVLGARRKDNVGEILVYQSQDLLNWRYKNALTASKPLGYMWECPDCIQLNGKYFLLFSPQGIESEGLRYQNIYQSGYAEVYGDLIDHTTLGSFIELDHGFDFYAPQTFLDEQNRRILIGWAGLPDLDGIYDNPTDQFGWMHCLTLPRVITEQNGKLLQNPVPELQALRTAAQTITVSDCADCPKLKIFETLLHFREAEDMELTIRNCCTMHYANHVLTLSMGKAGYGRTSRSTELETLHTLQIFVDTSVVEFYANNGEAVFTTRFYPDDSDTGMTLRHCNADGTIWKLNEFHITAESDL